MVKEEGVREGVAVLDPDPHTRVREGKGVGEVDVEALPPPPSLLFQAEDTECEGETLEEKEGEVEVVAKNPTEGLTKGVPEPG